MLFYIKKSAIRIIRMPLVYWYRLGGAVKKEPASRIRALRIVWRAYVLDVVSVIVLLLPFSRKVALSTRLPLSADFMPRP